ADPGLVCGGCRACHPPQAGEADGVAQAVAGQSLECAAVAGWNGHEVDALSGALVQDLLDRYGTGLPGALFSRVAQGLPFDEALRRTTGSTLIDVGEAFWARQSVLKRWLPVITSTAVLWFGITLLAIVAALKRRREKAAQAEAESLSEPPPPAAPGSGLPPDDDLPVN
ncbi:MAG TPA: hypothetical protein VF580_14255, partial [Thermoanaerobaculia bacterium]